MKKEKQLTAVEWLVNQLETGFNYNILEEGGYEKQRKIIFQEALELEHAQHQVLKMESKSELEDEAHKAYLYGHEVGFMKAKEHEINK